MENIEFFEVTIDRKTYDVISANTEFYAFIGKRVFCTFVQLMAQEDADRLESYIENEKNVMLSLFTDAGELQRYLAMFDAGGQYVNVKLIPSGEIQTWVRQTRQTLDRNRRILELIDDYYYEYDAKDDHMRVYSMHVAETDLLSGTLAEFERALRENLGREDAELKKMIVALEMGARSFSMEIEGNVLNVEGARYASIKGFSCYENNRYLYAAGYIRVWNDESRSAKSTRERDYLTGVLTKAEITDLAIETIDVKRTPNITVAIIDIDFFKQVNDVHGHMVGDEVLREVASIIEREVKNDGAVGRFGGDEFLVLFYHAYDMENMRERLRSIKNMVAAAFEGRKAEHEIKVTLSIGCAAFPKDADNYEDLFTLADFALYRAKEKGRNRYIIYNESLHGSLEEIRKENKSANPMNSRGAMAPAELVCAMMDRVYSGKEYSLRDLLEDIARNLNIQRVTVFAGRPYRLAEMAGQGRFSPDGSERSIDSLDDESLMSMYDPTGVLVLNNVLRFEKTSPRLYESLRTYGIMSFLHVKFKDKNGVDGILSFEILDKPLTWNKSLIPYYRLLGKLLEEYAVL